MHRPPLPHLLRARDWQDRPEFHELCDWWRQGGVGVAALVGIGGAGKTAIADRFLQVVPGGYPEHPKARKDATLGAIADLFIFSFYDAPNPDVFFAELSAWLGADAALSYPQLMRHMAGATRSLLVLDGLEKVQDDGLRGGILGQLLDERLRDFMTSTADGYLPHISIVATSRFRFYDPLVERASYFVQIDVDRLQRDAALQLLRDRGARGTDDDLEIVARDEGFHALSVDLAGGYIARFCGGDPEMYSRQHPPIVDEEIRVRDVRAAALRKQELRFARLAARYHEAMAASDPAALALLQRLCLFRLGIDSATIVKIFTGKDKERISGPELAVLQKKQVEVKLDLLTEMRLIEEANAPPSRRFSVHPAVRDGFVRRTDSEVARLGHEAVRQNLKTSLGGHSSATAADAASLDIVEEIVHHTISVERWDEAWQLYYDRMGGLSQLGWRLGAYERGHRICRMFAAGRPPASANIPLSKALLGDFFFDWAFYLFHLGKLEESLRCLEREFQVRGAHASSYWTNAANVASCSGNLKAGASAIAAAIRLPNLKIELLHDLHDARGAINVLRGDVEAALEDFGSGGRPRGNSPVVSRSSYEGLLLRLGRWFDAQQAALATRAEFQVKVGDDGGGVAAAELLRAEVRVASGDLGAARRLARDAYEWALRRDAKHLLCWAHFVNGRIELAANAFGRARASVEDGLRIARLCGLGIQHIDLLLLRAAIGLREGRGADAERDVHVALDEGLYPSEESGMPRLFAADDPDCGYMWGVAEGLYLRGEAILLQTAQTVGSAAMPKTLEPEQMRRIEEARTALEESLELWRKLRDPDLKTELNVSGFAARETLRALDEGTLSSFYRASEADPRAEPAKGRKRFRVALSFAGEERARVRPIANELVARLGAGTVFFDDFYDYELARANLDLYLQKIYCHDADLIVVFVCSDYETKSWCGLEWRAIRSIIKERRDDEVMFVRTGEGEISGLFPVDGFLDARTRDAESVAIAIIKRLASAPRHREAQRLPRA